MEAEYLVNPACFALACLMGFWLFRTITSNFIALLGVVLLACNPVALYLAFDSNSHTPTLLCAVVGFWGLLRWWQTGRQWQGLVGGFALGYAAIIRYSEALFLLPVLWAVLASAEFVPWRLHRRLAPLIGWIIPIIAIGCINGAIYGRPWLTGYHLDREQSGFSITNIWAARELWTGQAQGNFETFYSQLNYIGLPYLWPVWIVGMLAMFARSWRSATLLALWIVPTTLLYLCYYYSVFDTNSPLYLRFFLPTFPGMILCALWVCHRAQRVLGPLGPVALGAIVAAGCVINLANTIPTVESLMESKLALQIMRRQVNQLIPPEQGNVIIGNEWTTNCLDSAGGYHLLDPLLFRDDCFAVLVDRLRHIERGEPFPVQREHLLAQLSVVARQGRDGQWRPRSRDEVNAAICAVINRALDDHKRVAIVVHGQDIDEVFQPDPSQSLRLLTTWRDRPPLPAKLAGIFAVWNESIRNPYPPANDNNAPWSIYEVVRGS